MLWLGVVPLLSYCVVRCRLPGVFGQLGCCRRGLLGVVAVFERWPAGFVAGSGVCPMSSLRPLGWAEPPISRRVVGKWDCRMVAGNVVYGSLVSSWLTCAGFPEASRCCPWGWAEGVEGG